MTKRVDPRDAEIGKRVRALRLRRGHSQTELGRALGITFQQVQKYERGTNRISASRLQRISEAFDVPVTFFYSGLEAGAERPAPSEFDLLQTSDAVRLIRAYTRIRDREVRMRLLRLTEILAGK